MFTSGEKKVGSPVDVERPIEQHVLLAEGDGPKETRRQLPQQGTPDLTDGARHVILVFGTLNDVKRRRISDAVGCEGSRRSFLVGRVLEGREPGSNGIFDKVFVVVDDAESEGVLRKVGEEGLDGLEGVRKNPIGVVRTRHVQHAGLDERTRGVSLHDGWDGLRVDPGEELGQSVLDKRHLDERKGVGRRLTGHLELLRVGVLTGSLDHGLEVARSRLKVDGLDRKEDTVRASEKDVGVGTVELQAHRVRRPGTAGRPGDLVVSHDDEKVVGLTRSSYSRGRTRLDRMRTNGSDDGGKEADGRLGR